MLLQISEPGQSDAPHEERLAVGIDLGTTNSLVATVRSGEPDVLEDASGAALLPSVVHYAADGTVAVGAEALARRAADARNTIASVKRLMGRGLSDIRTRGSMPYEFVERPGMVELKTAAGVKSPVEVSAEILKALRARAEEALRGELTGAVITVPAYFDDAQRQATKDAARLAGLTVLRLLNEPTAAALAYGLDEGAEGTYIVYDLGGGTFDVSVLKLTRGVFEVLATGGDSALGGDDFDHALFGLAVGDRTLSADDKAAVLAAAREAKEDLTRGERTVLRAKTSAGEISREVTRAEFEELTAGLIERTLSSIRSVLADAGLKPAEVKGVILVGGATRMPAVRREVERLFGFAPYTGIDPDKVVAIGAALQANLLVGNARSGEDWLLLDVTPLSLGLETMGGLVEKVIPRNSPIPVARAQDFTTFRDGQTAMAIHVLQGEREVVDGCRSLARFTLRGIPPMAAGAARIRVTFEVDADGLLSVSARESRTGVQAGVQVKPSYGLGDEEIVRMLKEGQGAAASDMAERSLREAKVEAARLVESTDSALASDADLLDEAERRAIAALRAALEEAAKGNDTEAIKAATDALVAGTGEFAARRMDRAIRRALSGKSVASIEEG